MARPGAVGSGYDVVVIGGGIVGAAAAHGLVERGQRVAVLDEGDRALRAARTNFGLVWVQSKGRGMPAYMHWTRRAADLWPEFAARLTAATGIDTEYRKPGGLTYCLGELEFERRRAEVVALRAQANVYDTEMVDRARLARMLPEAQLGAAVVGASYCPHDGHANPLLVLRALHSAVQAGGGRYVAGAAVQRVQYRERQFVVETPQGPFEAGKVVLAAGHGTPVLAAMIGLPAPICAQRGQILVTERVRRFLPLPGSGVRQTEDGTVLIGSSKEDTGFDDGTTVAIGGRMASRAIHIFPELARVRLQRTWGGIRVLTPDNHPVYVQSESCPGAFVALCHSGVTLASVHAADFAAAVVAGRLPDAMADFDARRFDVQEAA